MRSLYTGIRSLLEPHGRFLRERSKPAGAMSSAATLRICLNKGLGFLDQRLDAHEIARLDWNLLEKT